MHSKMNKNYIRIQVEIELEYRKIQEELAREKIRYRNYLLENRKKLKFILRGLPPNADIALIQKALEVEELHGLTVTQMYTGNTRNRVLLPLFSYSIA